MEIDLDRISSLICDLKQYHDQWEFHIEIRDDGFVFQATDYNDEYEAKTEVTLLRQIKRAWRKNKKHIYENSYSGTMWYLNQRIREINQNRKAPQKEQG